MMRRFALPLALAAALLAVSGAASPETPPSAESLLAAAKAKAKKERKNVLVLFGASWCGWCKRMDAMLADPKLKPAFERSYVIVHLVVLEGAANAARENPGGAAVMEDLGGKNAGLPFFAVLDAHGKKIADSLRTPGDAGTNTGFPSAPEEIAHFQAVLKRTAPKMDAKTRAAIAAYPKTAR